MNSDGGGIHYLRAGFTFQDGDSIFNLVAKCLSVAYHLGWVTLVVSQIHHAGKQAPDRPVTLLSVGSVMFDSRED